MYAIRLSFARAQPVQLCLLIEKYSSTHRFQWMESVGVYTCDYAATFQLFT